MRANIQLFNEDCLPALAKMADNSVNLVCIDPPYNIGKADWDKIDNYIEWMGSVFIEIQRVLKDNGSFYWFHNDMVQINKLMTWTEKNSSFVFNSIIHWIKPQFRSLSWKNPSDLSDLRSWFNCVEYCLFYTFQDSTRLSKIMGSCVSPIRDYIRKEILRCKGKISLKQINELLGTATNGGGIASAVLSEDKTVPAMITKEHYEKIKQWLNCGSEYRYLKKEYEELRKEYEELRYYHKLDKNHNNIWTCKEVNSGKYHVTQKPLLLIKRIIETSSKEGDIVLDCFMGSGTAGIACIDLKRNFIGCEKDKNNFQIAEQRINNHKSQGQLF